MREAANAPDQAPNTLPYNHRPTTQYSSLLVFSRRAMPVLRFYKGIPVLGLGYTDPAQRFLVDDALLSRGVEGNQLRKFGHSSHVLPGSHTSTSHLKGRRYQIDFAPCTHDIFVYVITLFLPPLAPTTRRTSCRKLLPARTSASGRWPPP